MTEETKFDITRAAMLVDLSIHSWGGQKIDREVSNEVADSKGATRDAGRYQKQLVGKEHLKPVEKLAGYARNRVHYRLTLPWSDTGARILPVELHDEYVTEVLKIKAEWENEIEHFLRKYPNIVEAARVRLNGMFREADYPTVEELKNTFEFRVKFRPIPKGEDFRVNLSEEAAKAIRRDMESDVENAISEASADLVERVYDVVSNMAEGLDRYGTEIPGAKKKGSFKDTLIGNVREIARLLPKFNVTGDNRLNKLAKDIEDKLGRYDADDLKQDDVLRNQVSAEAKKIAGDLQGFFGI